MMENRQITSMTVQDFMPNSDLWPDVYKRQPQTVEAALRGEQLQPILFAPS